MTKRNLWSFEETQTLLEILEEKKCLEKIEDKILHPNEIYQVVEQEMFGRGYYEKNAKQMRFRWQNLRKQYYRDRKAIEKGTTEKGFKKSPFYETLHTMLADRWSRRKEMEALEEENLIAAPIEEHDSSSDDDGITVSKSEMPAFEECFPILPTPSKPRLPLKRPRTPDSTSKVDAFQDKIKKVTKELNEDLFKKQKELIEYEFRLFANYTSGRDDKFKEMMATNTQTFLNGIRDLLQEKPNDVKPRPKIERRAATEQDQQDRSITQFFQSWDTETVNRK
ncbi:uncharacterized protein LOC129911450 [Episyrphus balteatus]|uniref:uncharacterized protein LOC129911450 n=1 Tax=Episyrphus balteatus TaxID=286459 RepID=UPI00248567C5|nr:uncharacterized protein LOC129911450 [Episyrphus balteatus]